LLDGPQLCPCLYGYTLASPSGSDAPGFVKSTDNQRTALVGVQTTSGRRSGGRTRGRERRRLLDASATARAPADQRQTEGAQGQGRGLGYRVDDHSRHQRAADRREDHVQIEILVLENPVIESGGYLVGLVGHVRQVHESSRVEECDFGVVRGLVSAIHDEPDHAAWCERHAVYIQKVVLCGRQARDLDLQNAGHRQIAVYRQRARRVPGREYASRPYRHAAVYDAMTTEPAAQNIHLGDEHVVDDRLAARL